MIEFCCKLWRKYFCKLLIDIYSTAPKFTFQIKQPRNEGLFELRKTEYIKPTFCNSSAAFAEVPNVVFNPGYNSDYVLFFKQPSHSIDIYHVFTYPVTTNQIFATPVQTNKFLFSRKLCNAGEFPSSWLANFFKPYLEKHRNWWWNHTKKDFPNPTQPNPQFPRPLTSEMERS